MIMIILTSPAKTLDLESEFPKSPESQPKHVSSANRIVKILKNKSKDELMQLYQKGEKISEINHERFQKWSENHNIVNSRPAIYTFAGDIYREIFPKKYTKKQQIYAQKNLRILSGLYGILKPYDLIQPYRLEMGTQIMIEDKPTPADYWKDKLTNTLKRDLINQNEHIILNLASQEYTRAIDFEKLYFVKVIKIDFKQCRGGSTQQFGLLSKKARGMMIEFCIKNQIEKETELKNFSTAGYKYVKTEKNGNMTFIQTN